MNPFFSIIIVCYNAGEELHKTLASVLEQTCADYEILIKDGESTDDSIELLPVNPHIRLFSEPDQGIYDAMNQAVDYVEGRYVLFLNCGDYLYDKLVLERMKKIICGHAELQQTESDQTACGRGAIFYGNTLERKTGNIVMSNPHLDTFGCYRNIPCHQCCFYASQLLTGSELKQQGRALTYDLQYSVRADYEHFLWCHLAQRIPANYVPVTICSYEGGGFSETKENRKRSAAEHKQITRRYMSFGERLRFRLILLLTLAPLRTRLAESRHFSALYQRLKRTMYRG